MEKKFFFDTFMNAEPKVRTPSLECLENILPAFERYYDVKKTSTDALFPVCAEFHSHNEQYFLIRSAHIADMDTNEFVFFAVSEILNEKNFREYEEAAWNRGLARVNPLFGHKNSDVTLVILADKIENGTSALIRKTRHYKSYKFGFYGWSSFRLVAMETSSGNLFSNRLGKDLKKLFTTINKNVSLE